MDFVQPSIIIYSISNISPEHNYDPGEPTFPMPLFPKVADVLVLSPLLEEPAGEP